jgi:hypothetical protein
LARLAQYTVDINDTDDAVIVFDSVDSPRERQILATIRGLAGAVRIWDEGGNRDTDTLKLLVPRTAKASEAVVKGLVRSLQSPPRRWKKALGITALVGTLLLLAASAFAQTSEVTIVQGSNTATVKDTGSSDSLSVAVVDASGNQITSFGGGTTDADDGSIAGGQTVGLSAALANVWSGAAWVRLTQGQATMAASLPVVIASNQSSLSVSQGSEWSVWAASNVLHGEPDADGPIKIGGLASAAVPTAVDNGDRVNAWFALNGQQATMLATSDGNLIDNATGTASATARGLLIRGHQAAITAVTGTLTVGGAALTASNLTGMGSVVVSLIADNASDSVEFQVSVDAGANWSETACFEMARGGVSQVVLGTISTEAAVPDTARAIWSCSLEGGITDFRVVDLTGVGVITVRIHPAAEPAVRFVGVAGTTYNDVPDVGPPVKIGGRASSTAPTAVATGDRVNAWFGLNGQLFNRQTDGTNFMPMMDAAARRGFMQPSDGTDNAQVTATAGGSLQVECAAGCGGAATFVDGGAGFTQESSSVNAPAGFIFDDAIGTTLTENDIAAARITAARAQVMRVEGATRGTYATLTGTSVDVNCTGGCGSPAASNLVTIQLPVESVAAPTAAVWYLKRQWTVPGASGIFIPTRAWAAAATAGTETLIGGALSMGSFNVSTNAFTDGSSVAAPRSFGRLIGCVTTVMSATATTITVTYTDDQGNTGNTTTGVAFAASSPVGNCYDFPLATTTGQMRDNGVRDVTAVSDTAAPTGVVELFGFNTTLDARAPTANVIEWSTSDIGQIANPEQMMILFKQAATTAQNRHAGFTGAVR